MKKLKWLVLVMCLVLGLSAFAVACGEDPDDKDPVDPNAKVEATDVSLTSELSMEVNKSYGLTAKLEPADVNVDATWTSSDPTVVTVTADAVRNGMALATLNSLKAGTSTITVTISGKNATCEVTVTEHLTPYWFIAGQSSAAHFNWADEVYREILDAEEVRILSPDATEKIFTGTVDLYKGDMFKVCKMTEASTDSKWKNQIGGAEAGSDATEEEEAELAEKLKVTAKTEKTELPNSGITDKDPPSFIVNENGKYEITLDLSGSAPVLSYKKVGEAAVLAAPTVFDLYMKGDYVKDWALPVKLGAGLEGENITASFTVKYVGAETSQFGLLTTAKDKDAKDGQNQLSWARSDAGENVTLVEGITNGTDNWVISAGVYKFDVKISKDGKITEVKTAAGTEDDTTIVVTKTDGYDIRIKGGYVQDWAVSSLCAAGLKGENLSATFTVEYVGDKASEFGIYVVLNGWDEQTAKGWCGDTKEKNIVSTAAGVVVPAEGNMSISAGVYQFTVTINADGQFESIAIAAGEKDANTVVITRTVQD